MVRARPPAGYWVRVLLLGVEKILGGFDAQGYLLNVAGTNGNPFAAVFLWMGQTPWFVDIVNIAVPWGEAAIGPGIMIGLLTRLAAFFGALLMLLYFGNWDLAHGPINSDFMYMLVSLSVAAFGADRILGIDAYVEQYEIDGQPLVQRYPALEYILGLSRVAMNRPATSFSSTGTKLRCSQPTSPASSCPITKYALPTHP